MSRHIWRCVTDGPGHPGLHLVLTVVNLEGGRYSMFLPLPQAMLTYKSDRSRIVALRWACKSLLERQERLAKHSTLQSMLTKRTPE